MKPAKHNKYKAIIFDLDGTLRHHQPTALNFVIDSLNHEGIQKSDLDKSDGARWAHYYWAQSSELLYDIEKFDELEKNFWRNYARRQLIALGLEQTLVDQFTPLIFHLMEEEFQPIEFVPDDVVPTLEKLKSDGYLLSILSNRRAPCQEDLERLGIIEHFGVILTAGEVNAWKPDPAIFYHLLDRLDIYHHQAVYIGDNYFADVAGARSAGIQPILLDPEEVFPEPGCPVIQTISGILNHLE